MTKKISVKKTIILKLNRRRGAIRGRRGLSDPGCGAAAPIEQLSTHSKPAKGQKILSLRISKHLNTR